MTTFLRKKTPPSHQDSARSYHSWIAVLHKPFPIEIDPLESLPCLPPPSSTTIVNHDNPNHNHLPDKSTSSSINDESSVSIRSTTTTTTSSEKGIFVLTVTPPLRKDMIEVNGLLVPGLQLLAINDIPIVNDTFKEAKKKLLKATFPLKLRVYGVYAVGKRWIHPTFLKSQQHQQNGSASSFLGLSLNFNTIGQLRIDHVSENHKKTRFHSTMGYQSGMIVTNVNGMNVSTISSSTLLFNGRKTNTNHTNNTNTKWIKHRFVKELSTPLLFSKPPYLVAINIQLDFQAILKEELGWTIPECNLPLSLQSMEYKIKQYSDNRMKTTKNNSPIRPARRTVSLPVPTVTKRPSVVTPNSLQQPHSDDLRIEMARKTLEEEEEEDTLPNGKQPRLQDDSMVVQDGIHTSILDKSLLCDQDCNNNNDEKDQENKAKKKQSTFGKADTRLMDPIFLPENTSDDTIEDHNDDENESSHKNKNYSDNHFVNSINDTEHTEDIEQQQERPSLPKNDNSMVRIYGSRRSLQSGDKMTTTDTHTEDPPPSTTCTSQPKVSDKAKQQHGSTYTSLQTTITTTTSTNDLRLISKMEEGNTITLTFEKNTTNPRLGLILRQDFSTIATPPISGDGIPSGSRRGGTVLTGQSTTTRSDIVIHGVLQGGVFSSHGGSSLSYIKAGQIIEEIQGQPCPQTTSETFDLLTNLTGPLTIKLKQQQDRIILQKATL